MSIVTNGTTIPVEGDNVIYDGVAVTAVVCNGVYVWIQALPQMLTIGSSGTGAYGYNAGLGFGDLVPDTLDTLSPTRTISILNMTESGGLFTMAINDGVPGTTVMTVDTLPPLNLVNTFGDNSYATADASWISAFVALSGQTVPVTFA